MSRARVRFSCLVLSLASFLGVPSAAQELRWRSGAVLARPAQRVAPQELARRLVTDYHGAAAADAAEREFREMRERLLDVLGAMIELGDPAGEPQLPLRDLERAPLALQVCFDLLELSH